MNCNYCRLTANSPTAFDVLRKMIELNRLGVNVEISTDNVYSFRIRLYSADVEIVRFIPHYQTPFMESIIDAMLKDLKKGAAI